MDSDRRRTESSYSLASKETAHEILLPMIFVHKLSASATQVIIHQKPKKNE